ncbi:MAG: aminotransferase class III-fold pyridoxal phosphate-dependent enzyme, partial [Candidatus Gastranaerophilaceae bacterium]
MLGLDLDLITDEELLEKDRKYCSFADTAHYAKVPKVFTNCEGSYMYDSKDIPYLDLQMYFSAANFGYKNQRIINAVIDQMNTLPQITPKYIHKYKVLLSEKLCKACEKRFGEEGRINFNVGGAQAVEDVIKLVRKNTKRNGFFAFQGGYHGKTVATTALSSNFKYRENYGHYGDRAHFVPFPYCFRCPYDKKCDSCDFYCVKQFEKQFDSEYKGLIDPSTNETEFKAFIAEPVLGTGGYINAPAGYFKELKKVLDKYGIMFVD